MYCTLWLYDFLVAELWLRTNKQVILWHFHCIIPLGVLKIKFFKSNNSARYYDFTPAYLKIIMMYSCRVMAWDRRTERQKKSCIEVGIPQVKKTGKPAQCQQTEQNWKTDPLRTLGYWSSVHEILGITSDIIGVAK